MNIKNILQCFPNNIRNILEEELNKEDWKETVEEIRVKNKAPIIIKNSLKESIIKYVIENQDIMYILQKICENSLYSYQKQIANGYITIKGGNRVGIVGSGVLENEKVTNLNYISGMNFRISRQVLNCSNSIINEIIKREENSVFNTLIASPPGIGKTTLLKDIVRNISNGVNDFKGIRVSVIDERGELGASYKGIAQNDLGLRTDILDNIPKAIGMKMAIRSMAPKVIVADEIGSNEDSRSHKKCNKMWCKRNIYCSWRKYRRIKVKS